MNPGFGVIRLKGAGVEETLVVGWFVESLPDILEATLADKLVPDGLGVLTGRNNGDYSRTASAACCTMTKPRFCVESGELESLLESLHGSPQFLRRRAVSRRPTVLRRRGRVS
jgi:hypothetical protein